MADIDLERKPRTGWWWLVGLVALALIIWGVVEALTPEERPLAVDDIDGVPAPAVEPAPAAERLTLEEARAELPSRVEAFRSECAATGADSEAMGPQHEYTANCMERAASALDAVVRSDTVGSVVLEQKLDTFRQNADRLRESDPSAVTHANLVTETMRSAADLISALDEEREQAGERLTGAAEQVSGAAERIDPARPLLEQRDMVQRFFAALGDALEALAVVPA